MPTHVSYRDRQILPTRTHTSNTVRHIVHRQTDISYTDRHTYTTAEGGSDGLQLAELEKPCTVKGKH